MFDQGNCYGLLQARKGDTTMSRFMGWAALVAIAYLSLSPLAVMGATRLVADRDGAIKLVLQAQEKYNDGTDDEVVTLCDQAIEADPGYALAYVWKGAAYERKGSKDKAAEAYHKVIEIDPGSAAATKANAGLRRMGYTVTTAADATPLTSLKEMNQKNPALENATINGQEYSNAIKYPIVVIWGGNGNAANTFYLGRKYSRLRASVGRSDLDHPNERGAFSFAVDGDGRSLWQSHTVTVGDAPIDVDVDVSGILQLTIGYLRKDTTESSDGFWINPVLYKADSPPPRTVATILLNGNALATQAPIVDGKPCIPIEVLKKLPGAITDISYDAAQGQVSIETR